MALEFPRRFSDAVCLPVLAAEASARVDLEQAVSRVRWVKSGAYSYLDRDSVRTAVVRYLNAVSAEFATQAMAAVRRGELPPTGLDHTIGAFIANAQHQALYGIRNETVMAAWADVGRLQQDTTSAVLGAPWHVAYLRAVPELFASLAETSSSDSGEQLSAADQQRKATIRSKFVQPRLEAKRLTVPMWADLAGVNKSVAYDSVNGNSNPRAATLAALAEALGVANSDLPD